MPIGHGQEASQNSFEWLEFIELTGNIWKTTCYSVAKNNSIWLFLMWGCWVSLNK